MRQTGVFGTVRDARGRPLVVLRRTPRGTVMFVFKRYKDMTPDDRRKAETLYSVATSNGAGVSVAGDGGITAFLDFDEKEEKPCG